MMFLTTYQCPLGAAFDYHLNSGESENTPSHFGLNSGVQGTVKLDSNYTLKTIIWFYQLG